VNERKDELSGLALVLDHPVAPRAEFADVLLGRLLAELEPPTIAPSPSRPRRRRRRSLGFALAFAVALLGVAVTAVFLNGPRRASALDVIRQARIAFMHVPPFQATYQVALNPDGTNPNGPRYVKKGATATVALSYGGPNRLRTQIVAVHGFTSDLSPGSYQIYNGHSIGTYDPKRRHFFSLTAYGILPLEFLSWHGAYPDWERVCRGPNSRVFSDAWIASRDARHIRCGNFNGDVWELWIDRQTGLLLKVVGQVGGDDVFLGGGISTSAKGGFEIERLRYNPAFARRTFSPPPGAFDAAAALHGTLAKLPPFRAVFTIHGPAGRGTYVDEVSWLNEHTWRDQTLSGHRLGSIFSGAGSFSIWAHGTTYTYTAHDKTYYPSPAPGATIPPPQLLDYLQNSLYSPARCPIVGHERIDGRETDHRRCARYPAIRTAHSVTWATWEFWIDAATGLTLNSRDNGHDLLRVNSIQYHPRLPAALFKFVPPAGSGNLYKLEENPYYKTKLAPGKPAPDWHATTLAGGRFQLTDLRGKPVLLLLLGDWCGDDPVCNDLAPLEQAYKKSNHRTTVVWVDFYGNPRQATKIARLNHLTFPVVVDTGSAMTKAWAIQASPEWVLLDSRGRVIEARIKPQTVAQLTSMLTERRASR
jgi:peroxiredoxin